MHSVAAYDVKYKACHDFVAHNPLTKESNTMNAQNASNASNPTTANPTNPTATTERVSANLTDIIAPTGEVVGSGWVLSHPSYLPVNAETGQQAVMSGLLPVGAFVDPATGKGVSFVGKDGAEREGGLPVRLYGRDAEMVAAGLGEPNPNTQLLAVVPVAGDVLRLYRGPEGEPRFAVIRLSDVRGVAYQEIRLARLW